MLPTRYLFLDTEYTSHEESELLSLALVSLEGDALYLELDPTAPEGLARVARANAFVHRHVLPQFTAGAHRCATTAVLRERVIAWLTAFEQTAREVYVSYDWSKDYDLLEALLGTSAEGAACARRLLPSSLAILNTDPTAEAARQETYAKLRPKGLLPHHALADAWALAQAYRAQSA